MTACPEQYMRFYLVDTFCHTPYSGSPAGVIPDAGALSDEQMNTLARQLNLVETVFCNTGSSDEFDAVLSIFPAFPHKAINGNPILAASHVLLGEGLIRKPAQEGLLRFRISGETVTVHISKDGVRITYSVDYGNPGSERASQYKVDLIRILNVETSDYDPQFTIQKSSVLLVPLRRLHSLLTFAPSFALISTFLKARKIDGICAYSTETIERESAFHVRYFSSRGGAMEEPATGFIHAEVAAYLVGKEFLTHSGGHCLVLSEQGDAIGRASRLKVKLALDTNGGIEHAYVGGSAVTVARGEIQIPK